MGKFSEKAKKIDMYASTPSLSFGKDGKVYSRLGLLLTLLTIIIIGGMAIWIGIKIFGRQEPAFVQYELPAKTQDPQLKWSTDDWKFGLFLTADGPLNFADLVQLDSKYYHLGSTIDIENTKCEFDFQPGIPFDCFEQKQSTKGKTYLDTRGYWGVEIKYEYCSTGGSCETPANAKTALQANSAFYLLAFEDLLIDPFNYENPVTTTESYDQDFLQLDIGRTLIVELNEVEFTSDNGWLFEDLSVVTKLKPTLTLKVSNEEIFAIRIMYGGTKTVYKRTYPKIQDFLAQISGLITIITPIFLIMVAPYLNLRAVQQMVNEIYEIKLNNKPRNGSDSPKRYSSSQKRKTSAKYKPISSKPSSPTTPLETETEGDLLPKTTLKNPAHLPPVHTKNPSNDLHTRLSVHHVGSFYKEENLATPHENASAHRPHETYEKSPSPLIVSSKITPKNDDLTSPEKVPIEHIDTISSPNEQEKPEEDPEAKENTVIDDRRNFEKEGGSNIEEVEEEIPLRTSDILEVPWQDWLRSFIKPMPHVQMLKEAEEYIMETFDLVTLSKKVVEIDKLKACLLTHDQRVMFENLPSSVIVLNPSANLKAPEAIQQYHWKESFRGDESALKKAYSRLKNTENSLDQRLIRLYESEFLDDGDAMVRQEEKGESLSSF